MLSPANAAIRFSNVLVPLSSFMMFSPFLFFFCVFTHLFPFTCGADAAELHLAALHAEPVALRARRDGVEIGQEYVAYPAADAAPAVRMRRERVIVARIAAEDRDAAHLPALGKPAENAEHRPPRNGGMFGVHALIDLRCRGMIEARERFVDHLLLPRISHRAHRVLLNKTYS